jgi:hypothetical protein
MANYGALTLKIYSTADPMVLQRTITTCISARQSQPKSGMGRGEVRLPAQLPAVDRDEIVAGRVAEVIINDGIAAADLDVGLFIIEEIDVQTKRGASELVISGPSILNELTWRPINKVVSDETSMTATSGSSNSATFGAPDTPFTTDEWKGYSIRTQDNLHYGVVESNDTTTITLVEDWTDGQPTWSTVCILYGIDPTTGDVDSVMDEAPAAWGPVYETGPGTVNGTIQVFNGESVLEGLVFLAEQSGEFFRLYHMRATGANDRTVYWRRTADSSGVTLFMPTPSNPLLNEGDTAYGTIISLKRAENFNVVSRVYATGAGLGDGRLTLQNATITPPSGYDWVTDGNGYKVGVKNTTLETAGTDIYAYRTWSNIQPATDSAEAIPGAADALAYVAINYLKERAENEYIYRVRCVTHKDVRPGQTIDLSYTDVGQNDLVMSHTGATELFIQKVTHFVGKDGVRYTDLILTENLQTLRESDESTLAKSIRQYNAMARHASATTNSLSGGGLSPSDHGALTGLADDDHAQYLRADGARDLTGNMLVSAGITIDGVDIGAHDADVDAHHNQIHVLATAGGLGGDHTMSGATIGHVLRASGATTAAFAELQHTDLGGVTTDQHHAKQHVITSSADHTVTGSQYDLVGLTGTNVLGILTPSANPGAAATILRSDSNGYLQLTSLGIGITPAASPSLLNISSTGDTRVKVFSGSNNSAGIALWGQRTGENGQLGVIVAGNQEPSDDGTINARIRFERGANVDSAAINLLVRENTGGVATTALYIEETGNIGLGTISPTSELSFVSSATIDTLANNLTLLPAGDLILDPTGLDVLPESWYEINLGSLQKKYLTLHAAELWVETLVAQNTIATIGGRVLVGPTTTITRDMGTGDTTIYVKHNQMVSGDRTYMEADGKVEFFAITSGATLEGPGDYSYTVTRNLDGSGANLWYAGDAMFNTGTTGNGFIDLYSVAGIAAGSTTGPTIVMNVRDSATYNDWSEHAAFGNLDGVYGYGVDTYGMAMGEYAAGENHITIESTNGIRFFDGLTSVIASWVGSTITLGATAGGEYVTVASTGIEMFSNTVKVIDIDASGNAAFGEVATNQGNMYWNNGNSRLEFRGSTNGTVLQAYVDTTGAFVAGGDPGVITLDTDGLEIATTTAYADVRSLKFMTGSTITSQVRGYHDSTDHALSIFVPSITARSAAISLTAAAPSTYAGQLDIFTTSGGSSASFQIKADSNASRTELAYFDCDLDVENSHDLRVSGGVYVGDTGTDPDDNDIHFDGNLKSMKNSTFYDVYGYVPLAAPLTSTSWDGDAYSSAGPTLIDLSSVFSAPAGMKAVNVEVFIRDSAQDGTTTFYGIRLGGSSTQANMQIFACNGHTNDAFVRGRGIIDCDANGDIYYETATSGASTLDVYLKIWGYYI